MRILFNTYELPPIGGGGGRAALQISRRLVRAGHDVSILSSRFGDLPETETVDGVAIHRITVRRARPDECTPYELLSFMRRSIPATMALAETFKPDVTCAFFGIPGGPAAWWLKARRGVPYVLSLRGSDVPRPEVGKHQRLHLFTKPFLRRLYRRADGIVAVSDSLRGAALAVAPDVKIEVIPNGIDTERFKPKGEKPFPAERAEILFVGRLREFKGVQDVLAALPQIERALNRPVRFTVVGDGPYRGELESLAAQLRSEGMKAEVSFLGWLDPDRVPPLYERASLFVLPSLVEGYPNVVLEAMAAGVPCVATDAPGIRDAIRDGRDGLLVPPKAPDAIAQSAVRLLSDSAAWTAMSRAAIARAGEFSWDRIASEYESLLRRAAGQEARS
jgi:glycosyltransferase involved in cell wall biosynthesis